MLKLLTGNPRLLWGSGAVDFEVMDEDGEVHEGSVPVERAFNYSEKNFADAISLQAKDQKNIAVERVTLVSIDGKPVRRRWIKA